MSLPQIEDFQQLFLGDVALLDVRAPVEYEQGAFPHTENIPILNDEERHEIGIRYKNQGQDSAIELGHRLVSGDVKESRIDAWADFFQQHPDAALYCFRGGMRSKLTQQWLYEKTGRKIPRVKGGYKALRQFLLQQLESASQQMRFYVLSGRTGVGKTLLLDRLERKIDLEKIYHHRGSVFGSHVDDQPSQIDIENRLAIELLKFQKKNVNTLVLEDESACIGARRIPENIFSSMRTSPILVLEASDDERIDIIFDEYITRALAEYCNACGEDEGFEKWAAYLRNALAKIQRRLGGKSYKELGQIMDEAISAQQQRNETGGHKTWIARLLLDYYDPMYDYQLSKKSHRVVFRGNQSQMLAFLKEKKSLR